MKYSCFLRASSRGAAAKLLTGDRLPCACLDGQCTTFGAVEACMAIWRKKSAHSGRGGGDSVGRGLFFVRPRLGPR